MLVFAIGVPALIGAAIVLEALAEIARLRRISRGERQYWLDEAPAASQPSSVNQNRRECGIGVSP